MIGYYYTDNIKNQEVLYDVVKKGDSKYDAIFKKENTYPKRISLGSPSWSKQEDGSYRRTSEKLWETVVLIRCLGVPVLNENTIDEFLVRLHLGSQVGLVSPKISLQEAKECRKRFGRFFGLYTAVGGYSRTQFLFIYMNLLSAKYFGTPESGIETPLPNSAFDGRWKEGTVKTEEQAWYKFQDKRYCEK